MLDKEMSPEELEIRNRLLNELAAAGIIDWRPGPGEHVYVCINPNHHTREQADAAFETLSLDACHLIVEMLHARHHGKPAITIFADQSERDTTKRILELLNEYRERMLKRNRHARN